MLRVRGGCPRKRSLEKAPRRNRTSVSAPCIRRVLTQFQGTSTHFLEGSELCGMLSGLWRNGRVVEGGSLENCCAARYRGFKSYFLRQICYRPGNLSGLFSFKRKATEHVARNHPRRISPLQRKRIRSHWHSETLRDRRTLGYLPRALWRARPLGAAARHVRRRSRSR